MSENAPAPYVAHADDLAALKAHFNAVVAGESRAIRLSAPLGGGKRALVGEVCRDAIADTEDDVLLWRVHIREEDEGMQAVLRAYASLYAALHRSARTRRKKGSYKATLVSSKLLTPRPVIVAPLIPST